MPDDTAAAAAALQMCPALTSVGCLCKFCIAQMTSYPKFQEGVKGEAVLMGSSGPGHRAIFNVEGQQQGHH